MLGSVAVGFLAGIGVAGWVYAQMMRRTGGNNQTALTTAGIAGFFAFVVFATVIITIDSMLGN